MKKLLLILLTFISLNTFAQMQVKEGSFKQIPNAIMNDKYDHLDGNDLPMALIKISTENIPEQERLRLKFSGNLATQITKTPKTGQMWIYISAENATFINIMHPDYGTYKYYLPEKLCDFCTYEMVLQYVPIVREQTQEPTKTQTAQNNAVTFIADQENTIIYIDDIAYNKNLCVKAFPIGSSHTWRMECDLYHSENGTVVITDGEPIIIERKLRKAYGFLNVKSTLLSDVKIYINDNEIGVTPYKSNKIKSGIYKLKATKEDYKTIEQDVTISDGDTTNIVLNMEVNYATITIAADSQSDIYIDEIYKGKGTWTGKLLEGNHIIESKKEHHKTIVKNIQVAAKDHKTITLEPPTFVYENININTEPTGQINGYEYVDLGLPSGTMWATSNVEMYGDLFYWGIGNVKIASSKCYHFDWDTFNKKEYLKKIRKTKRKKRISENNRYVNIEGNPKYDIARSVQGRPWRLPTKIDFQELIDKCIWVWMSQNDIYGYMVIGPNLNSIFLPAAGMGIGGPSGWGNLEKYDINIKGYYWTSVPTLYGSYALYFDNVSKSVKHSDDEFNIYSYSVRPVFNNKSKCENDTVNHKEIVIITGKDGDSIYIDNKYIGISPVITFLPFGSHKIKAIREDSTNEYVSNTVSLKKRISNKSGYIIKLEFKTKEKQSKIIKRTIVFGIFLIVVFIVVFIIRIKNKKDKIPYIPSGTINGHEYVDLGLPSGLKWATCNVGANFPEEYGDHFAWGETEIKDEYTEENCSTYFVGMIDISGNTKYDVALKKCGNIWRIPTAVEIEELVKNCIWIWTKRNGTNGYKVTGPNGKSIFLPAAGRRAKSWHYHAESSGFYWSSTPNYNYSTYNAYNLFFNNCKCKIYNNGSLDIGRSIRPVSN
ncbi:MAG: PEGA domain-containing protein [Bacteroidales bacterium]|nr:PEGA domain-containing protein [Bacteroidales bacterium]